MNIPSRTNPDRRHSQIDDVFILEDLRQMGDAKNYNQWVYSLLRPNLGHRVLEIGPGTGNITRQLINNVDCLVGMEPNRYCSNILLEHLGTNPRFQLIPTTIENSDLDQLRSFRFDTILCVNVLEHIEEDAVILRKFHDVIEPGGKIVSWYLRSLKHTDQLMLP